MRALNTPFVVVHDAQSSEHFHWFTQPEKFSRWPVVWTNGRGDTIRRLPGEFANAVAVDLNALRNLPELRSTLDYKSLPAYVNWAKGIRPVAIHWNHNGDGDLNGDYLSANEGFLVKSNFDPGWRSDAGRSRSDPIGFLLLEPPLGSVNWPRRIHLTFGAAWDVWLGRAIPLMTLILMLAGVRLFRVSLMAAIPTVLACIVLAVPALPKVAVAQDPYRRMRPPMINPGGIVNATTAVSIYGAHFRTELSWLPALIRSR